VAGRGNSGPVDLLPAPRDQQGQVEQRVQPLEPVVERQVAGEVDEVGLGAKHAEGPARDLGRLGVLPEPRHRDAVQVIGDVHDVPVQLDQRPVGRRRLEGLLVAGLEQAAGLLFELGGTVPEAEQRVPARPHGLARDQEIDVADRAQTGIAVERLGQGRALEQQERRAGAGERIPHARQLVQAARVRRGGPEEGLLERLVHPRGHGHVPRGRVDRGRSVAALHQAQHLDPRDFAGRGTEGGVPGRGEQAAGGCEGRDWLAHRHSAPGRTDRHEPGNLTNGISGHYSGQRGRRQINKKCNLIWRFHRRNADRNHCGL